MKILLMRGLPCSGKSTYAKKLVEERGHYKRINRDLLREMIDGKWSKEKEKVIRKAEIVLAELFLTSGFVPIIDDTNLSPSAMQMWQEFAKEKKAQIEIKDFTDVPLETCIERDKHRQNYVGEDVIRKMHRDFLAPTQTQPPVYDETLPDAVIIDLDGTLAIVTDRSPYDAEKCEQDLVNEVVRDVMINTKASVILVSGRSELHRPQTERWLMKNAINYSHLFMRAEGDFRNDAIVKREIYERHIAGQYNVKFTIDDRRSVVAVWRSLGLTCLQVAEGDY